MESNAGSKRKRSRSNNESVETLPDQDNERNGGKSKMIIQEQERNSFDIASGKKNLTAFDKSSTNKLVKETTGIGLSNSLLPSKSEPLVVGSGTNHAHTGEKMPLSNLLNSAASLPSSVKYTSLGNDDSSLLSAPLLESGGIPSSQHLTENLAFSSPFHSSTMPPEALLAHISTGAATAIGIDLRGSSQYSTNANNTSNSGNLISLQQSMAYSESNVLARINSATKSNSIPTANSGKNKLNINLGMSSQNKGKSVVTKPSVLRQRTTSTGGLMSAANDDDGTLPLKGVGGANRLAPPPPQLMSLRLQTAAASMSSSLSSLSSDEKDLMQHPPLLPQDSSSSTLPPFPSSSLALSKGSSTAMNHPSTPLLTQNLTLTVQNNQQWQHASLSLSSSNISNSNNNINQTNDMFIRNDMNQNVGNNSGSNNNGGPQPYSTLYSQSYQGFNMFSGSASNGSGPPLIPDLATPNSSFANGGATHSAALQVASSLGNVTMPVSHHGTHSHPHPHPHPPPPGKSHSLGSLSMLQVGSGSGSSPSLSLPMSLTPSSMNMSMSMPVNMPMNMNTMSGSISIRPPAPPTPSSSSSSSASSSSSTLELPLQMATLARLSNMSALTPSAVTGASVSEAVAVMQAADLAASGLGVGVAHSQHNKTGSTSATSARSTAAATPTAAASSTSSSSSRNDTQSVSTKTTTSTSAVVATAASFSASPSLNLPGNFSTTSTANISAVTSLPTSTTGTSNSNENNSTATSSATLLTPAAATLTAASVPTTTPGTGKVISATSSTPKTRANAKTAAAPKAPRAMPAPKPVPKEKEDLTNLTKKRELAVTKLASQEKEKEKNDPPVIEGIPPRLPRTVSHRDQMLSEAQWLSIDYRQERRWKLSQAFVIAKLCVKALPLFHSRHTTTDPEPEPESIDPPSAYDDLHAAEAKHGSSNTGKKEASTRNTSGVVAIAKKLANMVDVYFSLLSASPQFVGLLAVTPTPPPLPLPLALNTPRKSQLQVKVSKDPVLPPAPVPVPVPVPVYEAPSLLAPPALQQSPAATVTDTTGNSNNSLVTSSSTEFSPAIPTGATATYPEAEAALAPNLLAVAVVPIVQASTTLETANLDPSPMELVFPVVSNSALSPSTTASPDGEISSLCELLAKKIRNNLEKDNDNYNSNVDTTTTTTTTDSDMFLEQTEQEKSIPTTLQIPTYDVAMKKLITLTTAPANVTGTGAAPSVTSAGNLEDISSCVLSGEFHSTQTTLAASLVGHWLQLSTCRQALTTRDTEVVEMEVVGDKSNNNNNNSNSINDGGIRARGHPPLVFVLVPRKLCFLWLYYLETTIRTPSLRVSLWDSPKPLQEVLASAATSQVLLCCLDLFGHRDMCEVLAQLVTYFEAHNNIIGVITDTRKIEEEICATGKSSDIDSINGPTNGLLVWLALCFRSTTIKRCLLTEDTALFPMSNLLTFLLAGLVLPAAAQSSVDSNKNQVNQVKQEQEQDQTNLNSPVAAAAAAAAVLPSAGQDRRQDRYLSFLQWCDSTQSDAAPSPSPLFQPSELVDLLTVTSPPPTPTPNNAPPTKEHTPPPKVLLVKLTAGQMRAYNKAFRISSSIPPPSPFAVLFSGQDASLLGQALAIHSRLCFCPNLITIRNHEPVSVTNKSTAKSTASASITATASAVSSPSPSPLLITATAAAAAAATTTTTASSDVLSSPPAVSATAAGGETAGGAAGGTGAVKGAASMEPSNSVTSSSSTTTVAGALATPPPTPTSISTTAATTSLSTTTSTAKVAKAGECRFTPRVALSKLHSNIEFWPSGCLQREESGWNCAKLLAVRRIIKEEESKSESKKILLLVQTKTEQLLLTRFLHFHLRSTSSSFALFSTIAMRHIDCDKALQEEISWTVSQIAIYNYNKFKHPAILICQWKDVQGAALRPLATDVAVVVSVRWTSPPLPELLAMTDHPDKLAVVYLAAQNTMEEVLMRCGGTLAGLQGVGLASPDSTVRQIVTTFSISAPLLSSAPNLSVLQDSHISWGDSVVYETTDDASSSISSSTSSSSTSSVDLKSPKALGIGLGKGKGKNVSLLSHSPLRGPPLFHHSNLNAELSSEPTTNPPSSISSSPPSATKETEVSLRWLREVQVAIDRLEVAWSGAAAMTKLPVILNRNYNSSNYNKFKDKPPATAAAAAAVTSTQKPGAAPTTSATLSSTTASIGDKAIRNQSTTNSSINNSTSSNIASMEDANKNKLKLCLRTLPIFSNHHSHYSHHPSHSPPPTIGLPARLLLTCLRVSQSKEAAAKEGGGGERSLRSLSPGERGEFHRLGLGGSHYDSMFWSLVVPVALPLQASEYIAINNSNNNNTSSGSTSNSNESSSTSPADIILASASNRDRSSAINIDQSSNNSYTTTAAATTTMNGDAAGDRSEAMTTTTATASESSFSTFSFSAVFRSLLQYSLCRGQPMDAHLYLSPLLTASPADKVPRESWLTDVIGRKLTQANTASATGAPSSPGPRIILKYLNKVVKPTKMVSRHKGGFINNNSNNYRTNSGSEARRREKHSDLHHHTSSSSLHKLGSAYFEGIPQDMNFRKVEYAPLSLSLSLSLSSLHGKSGRGKLAAVPVPGIIKEEPSISPCHKASVDLSLEPWTSQEDSMLCDVMHRLGLHCQSRVLARMMTMFPVRGGDSRGRGCVRSDSLVQTRRCELLLLPPLPPEEKETESLRGAKVHLSSEGAATPQTTSYRMDGKSQTIDNNNSSNNCNSNVNLVELPLRPLHSSDGVTDMETETETAGVAMEVQDSEEIGLERKYDDDNNNRNNNRNYLSNSNNSTYSNNNIHGLQPAYNSTLEKEWWARRFLSAVQYATRHTASSSSSSSASTQGRDRERERGGERDSSQQALVIAPHSSYEDTAREVNAHSCWDPVQITAFQKGCMWTSFHPLGHDIDDSTDAALLMDHEEEEEEEDEVALDDGIPTTGNLHEGVTAEVYVSEESGETDIFTTAVPATSFYAANSIFGTNTTTTSSNTSFSDTSLITAAATTSNNRGVEGDREQEKEALMDNYSLITQIPNEYIHTGTTNSSEYCTVSLSQSILLPPNQMTNDSQS